MCLFVCVVEMMVLVVVVVVVLVVGTFCGMSPLRFIV